MGTLMREVVILLLMAGVRWKSHAELGLTFCVEVKWLDEPEVLTVTVGPNEKRWETLKTNAEFLGTTFAGKSEFPWIVDIRVEGKGQEYFSVGNLISSTAVFTCCRCIEELGDPATAKNTPAVYFSQIFLFEYALRPPGEDWRYGGRRVIDKVLKHEKCNIQEQYYDGGRIFVLNDIHPITPTIGLMKITFDYSKGTVPDFDLELMSLERRVCYVASFGRNYANIKNHLVKDYKVRYRVYWEPYELCRRHKDKMCPNRYLKKNMCDIGGENPRVEGKELMCFQARSKIGVVCDHDRGAPLVCEGLVFGIVVLGARADRCNNLLQLPFWVQKITMFKDYFEPRIRRSGDRRELEFEGDPRSAGSTSQKSHQVPISIMLLWFPFRTALSI